MQTISRERLENKMNSLGDLTLINTLPADQFKDHKIPGSFNVPQHLDDFTERVAAAVMNNKDAEIVVYCANADCDSSRKAAEKLEAAGFRAVFDYEGGAEEWHHSKQDAVTA